MARPNAVKSSRFRKQIDDMLANGETYTNIHKWLKKEGDNISRQTISNYYKNDFNIHDTAVEIYNDENSKENLNKAARKEVDVLEYYDKLIEKGQNTSFVDVSDKEKHELALKAGKQKTDYLKDEPDSPSINININDKVARLKRIEGKNEYRSPSRDSARDPPDTES